MSWMMCQRVNCSLQGSGFQSVRVFYPTCGNHVKLNSILVSRASDRCDGQWCAWE